MELPPIRRTLLVCTLLLAGACADPEPAPEPEVDDDDGADDDDSATLDDDDSAAVDDDDASPPPTGWRSELYPEDWEPGAAVDGTWFLHDFSHAGYRGGGLELPDAVPGLTVSVLDHGADPSGASDSCPAIQAAIDEVEASGGGLVQLPAGEYRCDGLLQVEEDGVVVEGEGPSASFLFFTRSEGMTDQEHLLFRGSVQRGPDLLLASDAQALDTVLRLEDASSLEPGSELAVGWLISDAFVDEHQMSGTWVTFNGQWRAFFRRSVVSVDTSVSPHEVTVDVPLRYPALVRDQASVRVETGYLSECGVQGLAVSSVVDWDAAWAIDRSHVIGFEDVKDCWVRDVASYESPHSSDDRGKHLMSGGLEVRESKRVTIADTVLEQAQNRGGGGNGYLFEITRSNEVLVRDCTGRAGRHNFIQNWDFGTSGCVWLRTVSEDGRALTSSGDSLGTLGFSEYHHSLAMANLVDDSFTSDGWQCTNRNDWSSGAGHAGTQNVFWNVRGPGFLRSFQFGQGYVVGTQELLVHTALADGVLFGASEGTEPEDWREGIDEGAKLVPQSLYEDQLARRLAREAR